MLAPDEESIPKVSVYGLQSKPPILRRYLERSRKRKFVMTVTAGKCG
jgi:hypothetical protein